MAAMSIERRSFLKTAAAALPFAALGDLLAQAHREAAAGAVHVLPAGQDISGPPRTLGFSSLAFKVGSAETGGNLFLIEHRNLMPNTGPPLHLHYIQEEWFYVMEGQVIFQVGDQRVQLSAGESVLAPRSISHTFSAVNQPAHLLIAFTPAGKMEQYFLDAAAQPKLAPTADLINRYEMQWIGPSPFWKA